MEKNPAWKDDDVSYKGLHKWIRRHLPKPEWCQICGITTPIELANISGKYLRNLNDWQWLCKKCHFTFDSHKRDKNGRFTSLCTKSHLRDYGLPSMHTEC